MLVRCGYLIGAPRAETKSDFDRSLKEEFLVCLSRLPGVSEARLLMSADAEQDAPEIYAVFAMTFADRAALDQALASEERKEMRASFARLMEVFDGRVLHINSNAVAIAAAL